eukprot:c24523_g1_i1 orf=204-851(+)
MHLDPLMATFATVEPRFPDHVGKVAPPRDKREKEAGESQKRQKGGHIQKQTSNQGRNGLPVGCRPAQENGKFRGNKARGMPARGKDQETERRKVEVKVKLQAQMNREDQEARRLEELRKGLEKLESPTKKKVLDIKKKIDSLEKELTPLTQLRLRKEKELKEAEQAYNQKSNLKLELVTKLTEIVTESERLRMRKLDELKRHIELMEKQKNAEQI